MSGLSVRSVQRDQYISLNDNHQAKYTNLEFGTRTPLIMRAPWITQTTTARAVGADVAVTKQGSGGAQIQRAKTFAELLDIFPT